MKGRKMQFVFALAIIATLLVAGCTDTNGGDMNDGEGDALQFSPSYEVNALDGYTGDAEEAVYVFPVGKEESGLRSVVVNGTEAPDSVPREFILVVFRGVFPTGGYGLKVENVTLRGNDLTVRGTYTNPGEGAMVTQAFTQPAAFIPLSLEQGSYDVSLVVTTVERGPQGDTVVAENETRVETGFTVTE